MHPISFHTRNLLEIVPAIILDQQNGACAESKGENHYVSSHETSLGD